MRYTPLTGALRNIRRVDYVKRTGKGRTALWQVHFTFKDRRPISQSFSDSLYGGKDEALVWAKRFRNAMENELAASDVVFGHTGKTREETKTGISRSFSERKTSTGTHRYYYWQAAWPDVSGKDINRKFFDLKCGGETASKQKAIQARQEGVEWYRAIREGKANSSEGFASSLHGGDVERAPYSLFMPPVGLDVPVWRYMDFTKFVSMLENGGLYLPRIVDLNDPFEGSFARGNEKLRPLVYRHIRNEFGLAAGDLMKRLRGWVAASCWHINEQESAGMWKLYTKTNEAVCIQSTFRKLRDALGSTVRVGVVRYVDYDKDWIPESNPLAPFLYKRKSFEHEREVRAVMPLGDLKELQKKPEQSSQPTTGIWQHADLIKLIEKVFVAPDAPVWFFELVKKVTERYEQGSIPVNQSSLSATPFY